MTGTETSAETRTAAGAQTAGGAQMAAGAQTAGGTQTPAGPQTAARPRASAGMWTAPGTGRTGRRTIDQMLAEARSRLRRVDPRQAAAEIDAGALLVDIRPQAQRAVEGEVPGALLIERNVLEWRFDPASASKLPQVRDHDVRVIIMCSEGYTSSLAAAALQDLGLANATDLDGGFHAWAAAGLPVTGGCAARTP
jgi:rhodanese-related sulfurtransferase